MADDNPKLTKAERQAAARGGITEERYAALKGVRNLDDWNRVEAERAAAEREDE